MALRIVAYVATITLSLITTVLLLYVSLGYRFDSSSGHVVKSGLLLVDNNPEAAQIYINDQLKDNATPGRFVLAAGEYNLKLARNGYRDWSKKVQVAVSGVREVTYPLLVPSELTTNTIKDIENPSMVSQSTDKKLLLMHVSGKSNFTLINLKGETVEETNLEIPASVKRENGSVGSFEVIEWSLNNKHVLLRQTLPSNAQQLISYNISKSQEAVNISALYGAETPTDVHYVGNDTDTIYGLQNTVLKQFSLKAKDSKSLLENIRAYQPYGDDTILFDRATASNLSEIGIHKDSTTTVVHTNGANTPVSLLKYAEFDDHQYLAVAPAEGTTITVYRDPLKKPVISKQLPFVTITFGGTTKLDFSDSSQFILAQNATGFVSYDIDDRRLYRVSPQFTPANSSVFSWINSHNIQVKLADGMVVLMDYDGSNQQELISAGDQPKLYFASNFEDVYKIISQNGTAGIQRASLVAE